MTACLQQTDEPLDINVTDSMGRTAIEIAVDNENIEIVELLLKHDNIKIGNALLCAIRYGCTRAPQFYQSALKRIFNERRIIQL